jgi:C1A family cysteine protease/predicted secreted protein
MSETRGIGANRCVTALLACAIVMFGFLPARTNARVVPELDASGPKEFVLGEQDDGRRVELKQGQVLAISLNGNPSTGFFWEVRNPDPEVLHEVGQVEFEAVSDLMGAPGRLVRRFEAVGEGQTVLELVYRRPWENGEPARTFSVQVQGVGPFRETHESRRPVPVPAAEPGLRVQASAGADDPSVLSLPAAYNWCDLGGCTPVRDQGGCGSCWAFATVGAFESNVMIMDGYGRDLAEQYLISCNTDGWGCGGGWSAFAYFLDRMPPDEPEAGAVYEADFPYAASDLSCNPPHAHHERIDAWHYVGPDIPPVADIKQAIHDYGPLYAGVCVGPEFVDYQGDVFETEEGGFCGNYSNHAVTLVGWDDSQGSGGAWLLKNSWGTSWGESGYMWIGYGTSRVGTYPAYVVYSGATPPNAPGSPQATPLFYTTISLTWTDNSNNESGFEIERSPDGLGDWAQIAVVGRNVNAISDGGLAGNTTYYYRVRAYNTNGHSSYSTVANATTAGGAHRQFLPAVSRGHLRSGFDSQFNGAAPGWESLSGEWSVDSHYYSTDGVSEVWSSTSYDAEMADLDYQAVLLRTRCDGCANALLIRGTPYPLDDYNQWYSFYGFLFVRAGYYSVLKRVAGDQIVALRNWTYSPAINQLDAWNVLRVVADGPALDFYINGVHVWSGSDGSLSSGRVGFGMYKDGGSANRLWADWATLLPLDTSTALPRAGSGSSNLPAGRGRE